VLSEDRAEVGMMSFSAMFSARKVSRTSWLSAPTLFWVFACCFGIDGMNLFADGMTVDIICDGRVCDVRVPGNV